MKNKRQKIAKNETALIGCCFVYFVTELIGIIEWQISRSCNVAKYLINHENISQSNSCETQRMLVVRKTVDDSESVSVEGSLRN